MSNPVTKVNKGGQQPVDEHQLVLRAGAHSTLPRPGGKPGPVTLMPRRTYLGNELSNHSGRQPRDPPVADDHCTRHVPHHAAMIDDPELDVPSLTVHEVVRTVHAVLPRRRRAL